MAFPEVKKSGTDEIFYQEEDSNPRPLLHQSSALAN